MFRRSKSESAASATAPDETASPGGSTARSQGKGRPTPTRREAEAAARARAKASARGATSRKDARRLSAERSRAVRQGIKDGDERYLPARDQGPVRRFVRDYVDHRLCMAEFAIPLLFASLVLSSAGLPQVGTGILNATLLVVVLDSVLLRFRLRRELKRRFPTDTSKGTTLYALMRSLQLRFLRLPKPQVKLGQALPERYR